MRPKFLVVDLDNTLYDWVTFFAHAFRDMLAELERLTHIDRETLVSEFKRVHEGFGESERAFSVLELPSIQKHFGTTSREELRRLVDPALHAFNRTRKTHLRLYPGVLDTLKVLTRAGVVVVAHTEATAINAFWRLQKLDIARYFRRLYALEGRGSELEGNFVPETAPPPAGLIRLVAEVDRKPNPQLLLDICAGEGFSACETVYVGDSLSKDISMAKRAGVRGVWAKYGTAYDSTLWNLLVSITHWTKEDVQREHELKKAASSVVPDVVIGEFSELKRIFL